MLILGSRFLRLLFPLMLMLTHVDLSAEVEVRAKLIEKSLVPTKEERGAYVEGMVNYLYEVEEVRSGELDGNRILVTHYGVYDDKEQAVASWKPGDLRTLKLKPFEEADEIADFYISDNWELDFELPRYHHIDQDLERQKPAKGRFNYGGSDFAQKLGALVGLRNQLKTIAIGDSQTAEGIVSARFDPLENSFYPVGLNAGIGSQRLDWLAMVVKDYAVEMPELEWIVLGINPRMFRVGDADNGAHEVIKSEGYREDRKLGKEGWPMPYALVDHEHASGGTLPNGYKGGRWLVEGDDTDPDQLEDNDKSVRRRIEKKYPKGFPDSWEMSNGSMELFEEILETADKRGIRVLSFIPPVHPIIHEFPKVVDEDDTTPEGYRKLVDYLEGLEKEFPNFRFEDINQAGKHFLSGPHFRDFDHLQGLGASKLTATIESLLANRDRIQFEPTVQGSVVEAKVGGSDVRWFLSNGTITDGVQLEHAFKYPGKYLIAVAVTEDRTTRTGWKEIVVDHFEGVKERGKYGDQARAKTRLHHDFKRDPRVIFADGTRSRDTAVVRWDFGDGESAVGWFVRHEYDKPGTYEVTATAYCENGTTDVYREKVKVE